MDPTTILAEAQVALEALTKQTADFLRDVPDLNVPIPGSEWTVREAAIHLINWPPVYCDIATGMPSPVPTLEKAAFAADAALRISDVPESDPDRLADLLLDGIGRFLETTAGRPGDQEVVWHCGLPIDLASLVCVLLGEQILHGFDMAKATGTPWPIEPDHARLVHYAYTPIYVTVVNPATTTGLTVGYDVELRGIGRLTVRFVDGEYRLEPPDSGPVDCTLSADPVAFLLVGSGRLSQWDAIALGHLSAGGAHPELALKFKDLFVYP